MLSSAVYHWRHGPKTGRRFRESRCRRHESISECPNCHRMHDGPPQNTLHFDIPEKKISRLARKIQCYVVHFRGGNYEEVSQEVVEAISGDLGGFSSLIEGIGLLVKDGLRKCG